MKNTNFYLNLYSKENEKNKSKTLDKENLLQYKLNTHLIINTNPEKILNPSLIEENIYSENFDMIFSKNFTLQNVNFIPTILDGNTKSCNQRKKSVSNAFFILGPRRSGKSTLLRGTKLVSSNSEEGLMISLMKEAYKMSLNLVTDKDDIIIIKLGMVIFQNEKIFNLMECPGNNKTYFDEFFINEKSDTTIYIKHFSNFREISFEIEKCLNKREDIIDLNWDHILFYHFIIEIKNKNLVTNLILQFDFLEFNFNYGNLDEVRICIENFLSKNYLSENNFLIERLLYRNVDKFDFTNFFLCLKNLNLNQKVLSNSDYVQIIEEQIIPEIYSYLKIINYFKKILARKDLLNLSEDNNLELNCKNSHNCIKLNSNKILNKKYKERELLIEEVNQINNDLKMIKDNIEKIKFNKSKGDKDKIKIHNKDELKIQRLYKNLSTDSIKLDKLVTNIEGIFDRTKNNISLIKNLCEFCQNK